MNKAALVSTLLVLALCAALPLGGQAVADREIISVVLTPDLTARLKLIELDLLMERAGRVFIVTSAAERSRLESADIPYAIETPLFAPATPGPAAAAGGINGAYHSYFELENDLKELEATYPSLAKLYDIGDSLEQRNIYALKISDNVAADEDEAEAIFLGCHHAREWISVEVPYLLAKSLCERYASDPEVQRLVDASEIWVVPLVNPDGLEYSVQVYRYWRKNRRANGDNSFGVDLNRNYGYEWGRDNQGSSPSPDSEVYRGAAPFSEPETQAVRDFLAAKNFQAMISFHSYSQIILYPWGYTDEPAPDRDAMDSLAADMAERIRAVNGTVYDYGQAGDALYVTNGDTTDWAYGIYGMPAYTIELPPMNYLDGGFFNAESDIQFIFNDNLPAMLYLVDYSIRHFVPESAGSRERDDPSAGNSRGKKGPEKD